MSDDDFQNNIDISGILEQINRNGSKVNKDSDPVKRITNGLAEREEQYTKLTSNYVKINYSRFLLKEIHKWVFFWVMLAALVAMTIIFIFIAKKIIVADVDIMVKSIPLLLGAFASFLSTVIAIPLLIGQYLFNKTEDSDMGKIVAAMQQYDRKGQELFENDLRGNK